MSENTFNKTLDFIEKLKCIVVNVSGGEPSLHPLFYDFCSKLLDRKYVVNFLSNGSFEDDDSKYEQIKTLTKRANFNLQIRSHPLYYKNWKKVMTSLKLKALTPNIFDDQIRLIPLGRAKINYPNEAGVTIPQCSNMFLISKQGFSSLSETIKIMEQAGKFCKPVVCIDGSVHAGETQHCVEIGNVNNTTIEEMFENLKRKKPCDKCGLVKNIPSPMNKILDL